jgi:hypothetical protein
LVDLGGEGMMAKKLLVGVVLSMVVVCASCSSTSTTLDPAYTRDTVEAVAALQPVGDPGTEFLQGLVDGTEEGFDVNEYLDVLTHLSLEQGYTLGYTYYLQKYFGGHPTLNARPEKYETYAAYIEAEKSNLPEDYSYSDHIRVDGTVEGFFEFVVLQIMGDQFYLYWHSGANDTQIVYNRARLWEIVNGHPGLPYGSKLRARTLNVTPVVRVEDDTVVVQVVTFSDWGGFVQRSYTIDREFPHRVLELERKTLVEYKTDVVM